MSPNITNKLVINTKPFVKANSKSIQLHQNHVESLKLVA